MAVNLESLLAVSTATLPPSRLRSAATAKLKMVCIPQYHLHTLNFHRSFHHEPSTAYLIHYCYLLQEVIVLSYFILTPSRGALNSSKITPFIVAVWANANRGKRKSMRISVLVFFVKVVFFSQSMRIRRLLYIISVRLLVM